MRAPDLRGPGLRLRVVGVGLLLLFALLAARAADLAVLDGRGAARGARQTGTVLRLAPARGTILDRDGAELAVTIEAPSVYAVPAQIDHPAATARSLARVLHASPAKLRKRLETAAPFVFLQRWVAQAQAERVRALSLPGIGLVTEPRRAYPQGPLAGALLGFANIDGVGTRGIEQLADAQLRGHARRIALERDARGQLLANGVVDPRRAAGGDVTLTLDATLQSALAGALQETVEATGAKGGLIVALDVANADLLALTEWPPFDPNHFRTTPYPASRSRAFLDADEPGSALKPFLVAAALEDRVVSPDEQIDLEGGRLRVPGKTIRDLHPHDFLDVAGILRVSSNVGAAKLGFRLGAERHYAALRAFGFGRSTGSGFPDESAGLLRPFQDWRPLDHATISFGQGLNVTAIQLAAATAALADGGIWRPVRLVKARRDPGGSWRAAPAADGRRVVRREVAQSVLAMLEGVVSPEGTARRAALRGVRVAGKTGTAQKLDARKGRYFRDRYRAWFLGVAPADAPEVVIVTMLDEPAGQAHTAGSTAAPLFAQAAAAALIERGFTTAPEMGLPQLARVDPQRSEVVALAARAPRSPAAPTPARRKVVAKPPPSSGAPGVAPSRDLPAAPPEHAMAHVSRQIHPPAIATFGDLLLLPDFRGLTPAEVKRVTARVSLEVKLLGRGRAVWQAPAPGTILRTGSAPVQVRFEAAEKDG